MNGSICQCPVQSLLERLVILLGRNKSTSEHLLSTQTWSCTEVAADNCSAWERTKGDLSQDLQVACRILRRVVYSELRLRAVGVHGDAWSEICLAETKQLERE